MVVSTMPYLTVPCFILVMVIIQASIRPVDAACLFGTASDCEFQCHCVGGAPCDPDTGVCPGVCAQDSPGLFTWSGEACQIGNVARGKTTNQTGTYEILYSDQAVDGEVIDGTHSDQEPVCAHPDAGKGNHSKWTVDLGGDYVIHNVTVFNTNNGGGWMWLSDLDVVVTGGPSGSHTCGHYTGSVPRASTSDAWRGTGNISCDAHPVGRYVTIEKTGGNQPQLMTLCEVVVTGHESHSCDECPQDCSPVIGCRSCPALGLKRPRCTETSCLFGTTSDCEFRCHCAGGATCDPNTGVCPGECAQGSPSLFTWSGEACQIGNVARGKITNQTGTYDILYSNQAVDGEVIDGTHNDQRSICAHPAAGDGNHAKWTVDLGGDYVIHSVTVFNTNDGIRWRALADFDVVVTGGSSGSHTCGHYTGTVPQAYTTNAWKGTANISCDAHPVGRYVIIEKTGSDSPHLMILCEVVVTGHESNSCDGCQDCSQVIGCRSCSSPGLKWPPCTEACDVGRYGLNCAENCSGLCGTGDPNSCSPSDGSCPGGCQQWYTGTNCGVFITLPRDNGESVDLGSVGSSFVVFAFEQNKDLPEGAETHYGYRISYRGPGSSFIDGPNVAHLSGKTLRAETISGLNHNTHYEFILEQYRTWGDSKEYGDTIQGPSVKTACIAPDQPTSTEVTSQDVEGALGSFTVTWQSSVNSGCDYISAYLVRYRDQSQGQSTWTNHTVIFAPDATSSGEVTPPSAGRYDVTLLVINNGGLWASSPVLNADLQGDAKLATSSIIQPALLAVLGCVVVALVITLVVAVVRNRGCRGVFNPSPTTQRSTSVDIPPAKKTGRSTAPPSESTDIPSESAHQGRPEGGYENVGEKDPQYENPVALYEDIRNTEEIKLQNLQGGQVFK